MVMREERMMGGDGMNLDPRLCSDDLFNRAGSPPYGVKIGWFVLTG